MYEIRVEEPNIYIVVFPQNCQLQREYCEKNKADILQRISSQLEDVPNLRFSIESSALAPQTHVFEDSAPLPSTRKAIESVERESHNVFSDSAPSPIEPEVASPKIDAMNHKDLKDQVESSVVAKSIQDVFEAELSEVLPPLIPEKKHSFFGN